MTRKICFGNGTTCTSQEKHVMICELLSVYFRPVAAEQDLRLTCMPFFPLDHLSRY